MVLPAPTTFGIFGLLIIIILTTERIKFLSPVRLGSDF